VPSALTHVCIILCARVFGVETLSFPTPESLQGGNILRFLLCCGVRVILPDGIILLLQYAGRDFIYRGVRLLLLTTSRSLQDRHTRLPLPGVVCAS
jgi:hypothetical protein